MIQLLPSANLCAHWTAPQANYMELDIARKLSLIFLKMDNYLNWGYTVT